MTLIKLVWNMFKHSKIPRKIEIIHKNIASFVCDQDPDHNNLASFFCDQDPDHKNIACSIDLARKEISYKPEISLEIGMLEALKEMYDT